MRVENPNIIKRLSSLTQPIVNRGLHSVVLWAPYHLLSYRV